VLIWAGSVRTVLFHHVTWPVNSICHLWGTRPHATDGSSGNVWWLALPSFGEAWHDNHHASLAAAHHGSGRFQVDLSASVLSGFERVGLV
jgi:stearoyl-CoA desaturase (delta-9 desaturase)